MIFFYLGDSLQNINYIHDDPKPNLLKKRNFNSSLTVIKINESKSVKNMNEPQYWLIIYFIYNVSLFAFSGAC